MRRAIILAILGAALAATPAVALSFAGREYTEADGLPSPTVLDVTQGPDGRLWFATRAGVVVYDGATWDRSPGAVGLTTRDVGFVMFDDDGTGWAVGSRVPVSAARVVDGEWCPLQALRTEPRFDRVVAAALARGADGTALAVATSSGGLVLWSAARWSSVAFDDAPEARVTALLGRDGGFLVGTTAGLYRLDVGDGPPRVAPAGDGAVVDVVGIFAGEDGAPWLVGRDWIGRYAGDRVDVLARELDLGLLPTDGGVRGVDDGAGGVLFGTPSTLLAFHPGAGLERVVAPRLTGSTALTRDREGIIWVAGTRGVYKIPTLRFARLGREDGLVDDEVTAVFRRRSGRIVLGHPTGLTLLGDPPVRIDLAESGVQPRVTAIAEADDGTLWAAATWFGLVRVDPDGTVTRVAGEGGFPGPVAGLLIDDQGTLWTASGGGVYRLGRGSAEFETIALPGRERDLGPIFVRRIDARRDGALLLSTSTAGVLVLRDGRLVGTRRAEAAAANNVFAVSPRPDGAVWVGTEAGLRRIVDDEIVDMEDGAPAIDRPVYFIGDAADGRVWIGTDRGVVRVDGDRMTTFDESRGLAGAETNREAFLALPDGAVWIGTDRGLSIYRPDLDVPRPGPPTVEIVAVTGDSGAVGDGHLIADVRAIAFVDEARVRFRYRLVGHDDDWIGPQPLPDRRIRYANLAPGTYRLEVQVVDVEGRESAVAVRTGLRVAGPFWRRPWLLGLAALAVAAFVWIGATAVSRHRAGVRLEREVRDRTEQLRLSRAEIASERATLDAMLRNIADGVCLTDEHGTVVVWSPGAARITGRPPAEALGRPLRDALGLCDDAADPSRSSILRAEACDARGERRALEIVSAAVHDPAVRGQVLAFRDVTERERAEREAQQGRRIEALGLLAGGIAHDFNNLLMVVLGNLDLLDDAPLGPGAAASLADARAATTRAQRLTGQLLTFSRGGAPVRRVGSIVGLIRESAELLLGRGDVRVEVNVPDDLWPVEFDPGQIDQVLQNLLLNARQSAGDGGTIVVRGRNVAAGPAAVDRQRCIAIEVEDDGPGIPPEHLERIFDPYFSTRADGTGLGLSTAYSIARRHGGLLEVESTPGRGAVFRLVLRAAAGDEAAATATLPPVPGTGRGRHVLLMDDDAAVRSVVGAMLQGRGFDVEVAVDGEQAVEAYRASAGRSRRFDLVILDLVVPGRMGGADAAARIREFDPDARLVAMSGYSNDDVMAAPARHGFRAGLPKPFSSRRLADVIREALRDERVERLDA